MSGTTTKQDENPNSAEGDTSATTTGARPTIDQIRSAVFGAKPQSVNVTFFGNVIELKQPTVGRMMEMRQGSQDEATVSMLVNYAFLPDTDEHIFTEADAESIMQIPFGPDMVRLGQAVNELVGFDKEALDKLVAGAEKSPAAGQPGTDGNGDSE